MKKVILFFSCLCALSTSAQVIVVRDANSHEAIPEVVFSSNGITTNSNRKGEVNLGVFGTGTVNVYGGGYALTVISIPEIVNGEILLQQKTIQLDEVVLSPGRVEEHKINTPYTTEVIDQKRIEFIQQPTTAEVLQNTGNVFVQKSQLGGGSPVLRGFEASRVLIVVDGVRMNNAIYRAGHLQDIITLDANMLDRTEVLFGPSSTLYGSDALGGVMNFYTKNPSFGSEGKMNVKGNAVLRYGSASNERTGHLDLNLGWKRIASMTNVTYSQFDDLMSGHTRLQSTPASWKRDFYATRINGRDSMMSNSNPYKQVGTAYNQMDLMQKLMIYGGAHMLHTVNFQYSTSSDIPRYDRLTEYSSTKLKYAEWSYGPQNRILLAYNFQMDKRTLLSDHLKVTLANQNISQQRISRNFGSVNRKIQTEEVNVQSINADVQKRLTDKHELRYGTELQLNDVVSTAKRINITTDVESPADTRYASGGSSMNLFGFYAAHSWKVDEHFTITDGLRFSATSLYASFTDTTFFKFPYTDTKQKNSAVTGNLGFTWQEENNYKLSLLANTGFRSPNVDDLTKVFESNNNVLIVPNENIKPEYATNFEINLLKIIDKRARFDIAAYYTVLENAMVLDNFQFNGQDSVSIAGNKMKVQATQNKDRAYIYGFSSGFELSITRELSIKGTINYTYGRYENVKAGTVVPLDHIPPVFGQTSLFYKKKGFTTEFFVRYNGAKRSSEYSSSGEDNAQYSADPVKGYMPAWMTINARVSADLYKGLKLALSCENITDVRYRVFASGVNAPGRNFLVSLRYKL